MTVTVLTKESLIEFKKEMLNFMKGALEPKPAEPKKWLRASELQKFLEISSSTLQTLRNNGIIKYYKDYGPILYDYEHIKQLLEENSSPSIRIRRNKRTR